MRTFFALEPNPRDKLHIERWREKAMPAMDAKIPAANFHLTLAFLGNVESTRLEELCQLTEQIDASAFTLHFNQYGYFSKPGIFWLGCETEPELQMLAAQLQQKTGLSLRQQQEFVPHISLYRNCETPPPAPLFNPEFSFQFEQFALYQSVNTQRGVRYHCLQQWPLKPKFRL